MPEPSSRPVAEESEPVSPPSKPPAGRERLLGALRRPTRSQVVVGVLLALLGYAAVTQVRFNEVDNSYTGLRDQELVDILSGLAGTSQRAEAEIARLQRTRDDLLSDTGAREAALAQAKQESDHLAILAGLVPVTGPGIRVTVTEVNGSVGAQHMVDTIQELRTAGAEAIQINGTVRVVADTWFEDATGGLLVDGQRVSSPYVIDAIGDPHTLASSGIDFPQGPRDLFEADGATVQVEQLRSLDIESVAKAGKPAYAQPGSPQ